MRSAQKLLCAVATAGVLAAGVPSASAITWEERAPSARAFYTTAAMLANVMPISSAFVASRCVQGYLLCKFTFASLSVIAAAESIVMSGGSDMSEPKALLERGFSGDWYLTGPDISGDKTADPYPEVAPPATDDGGFTPPPI
ncbi:MAG: hypothetical protein KIT14_14940 [bacterium]|nr:hypothetical protein [bacterium]